MEVSLRKRGGAVRGQLGGAIVVAGPAQAEPVTAFRESALFGMDARTLPGAPGEVSFPAIPEDDAQSEPRRVPAPTARLKPTVRAGAALIEREAERGGAFLLAPVFIGLGAVVYFLLPFEPSGFWVAAAGACATIAAIAATDRTRLAPLVIALALLAAGLSAAKIETLRVASTVLGSEITTRLTGRIVRIERLASGRERLTIDVLGTERPTLRYAPERIRASARTLPDGLVAGSIVSGVVRLMPPTGPVRPHGYDFGFESYFEGRGAGGFFLVGPTVEAGGPAPTYLQGWSNWVETSRDRLAARIRGRIGGAEGEIAAALIAGVRGGIPETANEALRKTGLAHVLSISGLHMALVAATMMVSIRFGFALFPGFSSRRPVKKYAAALALVAAALYLVLSGAEVAARRSFIMLAVMLVALLFDQAAITMRNLAISAILILIVSPHEIMGPSFQMSFAATAALIAAYAAWSNWRERRPARAPVERSRGRRLFAKIARYALGLAVTSLVAGLATTLYGVWHFQRVSPLSLAANLAAMPLVSVLVMPPAVLAMVMMPFGLDGPALAVMGKGLTWMLAVADWFAARSPVDAVGQMPASALVLLTIALVIVTLSTTRLRWTAAPFAVAGLVLLLGRTLPDVYVSEDARLVAARAEDGLLAVNRTRPNDFTLSNWRMAANARRVSTPTTRAEPFRFDCSADVCVLALETGTVVHAPDAPTASRHCRSASLIVIARPAFARPCLPGEAAVIDARDLARKGSAEISFRREGGRTVAHIRHAIAEPYRPWHAHRAFSRAARGLPPHERKRQAVSSGGSARPAAPAP